MSSTDFEGDARRSGVAMQAETEDNRKLFARPESGQELSSHCGHRCSVSTQTGMSVPPCGEGAAGSVKSCVIVGKPPAARDSIDQSSPVSSTDIPVCVGDNGFLSVPQTLPSYRVVA